MPSPSECVHARVGVFRDRSLCRWFACRGSCGVVALTYSRPRTQLQQIWRKMLFVCRCSSYLSRLQLLPLLSLLPKADPKRRRGRKATPRRVRHLPRGRRRRRWRRPRVAHACWPAGQQDSGLHIVYRGCSLPSWHGCCSPGACVPRMRLPMCPFRSLLAMCSAAWLWRVRGPTCERARMHHNMAASIAWTQPRSVVLAGHSPHSRFHPSRSTYRQGPPSRRPSLRGSPSTSVLTRRSASTKSPQ